MTDLSQYEQHYYYQCENVTTISCEVLIVRLHTDSAMSSLFSCWLLALYH